MKIIKIALMPVILLLLAGCLSTSYDAAMKREPLILPPSPPEARATPSPGSIWLGATSNNMMFTDRKARNVNDIVTIVIDENSAGANNANTDVKRDATTAAGFTGFLQTNPDTHLTSGYSVGGTSNNQLKGEGKTNRDGTLKGRVSARVVRVLPNGNFIIEGRRMLTVNAEDQFMVITGLIRPDDITSDNLIFSQYIADARIVYAGKGVVDDKMRPGWGTRIWTGCGLSEPQGTSRKQQGLEDGEKVPKRGKRQRNCKDKNLTVGWKMSLKRMHKGILTGAVIVLLAGLFLPVSAGAARIKDIASIGGIRDNQLVGYGLVVGLMNSGDSIKNGFTRETLSNMLSRQGLAMRDKDLKSNNIAAVMVTAVLPPFAKMGGKLDVMVSSVGDAKSLLGGTLLMTPLRGADGEIYAVVQGAVVVGGFVAGANSGSGSVTGKNHTTVGYIINGALIEKELQYDFEKTRQLTVNLYQPDFTTLNRLASTLTSRIEEVDVKLVDSGSALITVKNSYKGSIVSLLSTVENLDVSVDTPAIVVLNEKTGTVVMGENVRISTIAVAHGNLSFAIREEYNVSQPLPYAPRGVPGQAPVEAGRGVTMGSGGQTVVTPSTQINVAEEKKALMVVARGVTIQDVVRGLNAMGVTPRDLIQILQTIKAAGALQADLKVM